MSQGTHRAQGCFLGSWQGLVGPKTCQVLVTLTNETMKPQLAGANIR